MEKKITKPRKTKRISKNILKDNMPSDTIKLDVQNELADSIEAPVIIPADDSEKLSKSPNEFSKTFIFIFFLVIILFGGIYYNINLKSAKADDSQIIARLKTIILLPDVVPTMAVVTNADALKNQQPTFFADVKNGDRLIIYPNLAIIYDYESNKIIKIEPVQTAATTSIK